MKHQRTCNWFLPISFILGILLIDLCVEVSGRVQSNCPNDCSAHLGRGICDLESHECICNAGFAGSDCSLQDFESTEWDRLSLDGNASQCASYQTCYKCSDNSACGWCEDAARMGSGKCLPGGETGPQKGMTCPLNQWHFTLCPSCQCNGHSPCTDGYTCQQPCGHFTTGPYCDKCLPGYWGNPMNGGSCRQCDCNGYATNCDGETGKCSCNTIGVTGDNCEKCDALNQYQRDPINDKCYYDLTPGYQFTFNLTRKAYRHRTQINFRSSPTKFDTDTLLMILCATPAKMNITVRELDSPERTLATDYECSDEIYFNLSAKDFQVGIKEDVPLTTFYIHLYDLKPPLWIRTYFKQYDSNLLNLVN